MSVKNTRGMHPLLQKLLAASAVGAVVVAGVQPAVAGISSTRHNLGSTNNIAGGNKTSGTAEICVFCHTPHASNTAPNLPLWNKVVTAGSFTVYDSAVSSTINGTVNLTGGTSLACLSCHDGVQSMDNVINMPGSGGINAGGTRMAGIWSGSNVSATGVMTGVFAIGSVANGSLANDHPVGIQYCGGGVTNLATSTANCADKDFKGLQTTGTGANTSWWIDSASGTGGARDKLDIQLYTSNRIASTIQPMVECGSCHDPHSGNTSFLRIPNTGSQLCLSCHSK